MNLTLRTIDALQPTDKDQWVWDDAVPGFGVRVQPSGRKTYVIRYRNTYGRSRSITIGRCCDLTPTQARDQSRAMFVQIKAGHDPSEIRDNDRAAPTVAELHTRYMEDYARPYKKPRSAKNDETLWSMHLLPEIGSKAVKEVTKEHVQKLHAKMRAHPSNANRMLALVSKAWNLAIEWKWATVNPAKGTEKFPERMRGRILTPTEVQRLNTCLNDERSDIKRLLKLLLLTGCRVSEIRDAKVEWIDWERRLLMLPDSKVGQRHVALPRQAMPLLEEVKGQEWICPGQRGKPTSNVWSHWRRIRKRAGLDGVRIHDIRHTVGSMSHKAGLSQREIAALLGHKQLSTTERYLHGHDGDDARAAERVAEVMGI